MSTILLNQTVKNEERRRKLVRHWIFNVQRISTVVLLWLIFIGSIYGFYYLLFEKGLFTVKSVEIDGEFTHLSTEKVREAAGINVGANIFGISLSEVEKRISSVPWVKEAAVARKLPGTIWIFASEYKPFAILLDGDVYYVDKDGIVFKSLDADDDKNFPVLTGASRDEGLPEAISLLKKYLNSQMAEYFEPAEINIDVARGASVIVGEEGILVRLGFGDIQEKLERLYSMLPAIQVGHGKIRYVDLNIPGKVVVKYEG